MGFDLDKFEREYFKFKVLCLLLPIFLVVVIGIHNPVSEDKYDQNRFVEQLDPEDIHSFEVLYGAETLLEEYDLLDVQYIEGSDTEYSYISSVYEDINGREITFIQSEDPYFDEEILQQTSLDNTSYDNNIYYFTQLDSSNLLFWYNNNITYFLFSDFDYEKSKELSQVIIAHKIN